MGHWPRGFAYHLAGGDSLFSGAVLLFVAVGIAELGSRNSRVVTALAGGAALLIALSTAPLPTWLIFSGTIAFGIWLWRRRRTTGLALLACLIVAVSLEGWIVLRPIPPLHPGEDVAILGDSLSAVFERRQRAWPTVLADEGYRITNLAEPGARTSDGLRQARQLPLGCTSVIIFLGGNDLLAGTVTSKFEQDLNALLDSVSRPDRKVYLIELPALPLHPGFGRVQRRIAARTGAILLPRRIVTSGLSNAASTTDGLHLSAAGAERLGKAILARLSLYVFSASKVLNSPLSRASLGPPIHFSSTVA